MKRKLIIHIVLAVPLLFLFSLSNYTYAFSLQDVAKKAKALSEKSFVAPKSNLSKNLMTLPYADYQKIHFNHDKTYGKKSNSPFKLEFYHQGMYFDIPVKINEITATTVKEIKYRSDYFDMSALNFKDNQEDNLGFAGFKVQYPINKATKPDDEIFSALGASYFRVIGKNQVYGTSARGLAIDTGLMSGEEFPRFREFWIERPKNKQRFLTIYALLDSPRVTGAYRFIIQPGSKTIVDVESQLYFRSAIEKVGIAPLTSMFLYGKNQPSRLANYRPAMHDANGLSILTQDGRWIWRPLNNPQKLSFSDFSLENPKAFGLIQRDNGFDDYQDLDDHYEMRPSVWVESKNNWGKGHIELIEIPTADETNDNIVSYWVSDKAVKAGDTLSFKYRINFMSSETSRYPKNIAVAKDTFYSLGDIKQANLTRKFDGSISYIIDFSGGELSKYQQVGKVKPFISINDNGEIVGSDLVYNPSKKGWRVILRFKVKDETKATELNVSLVSNDNKNKQLTETWNAQYSGK